MVQKKKTTKPTKKQLKQKQRQRQYQKQSVVVNVNTPVKRRSASGVKKSATVYPLAPQLIQSVPLQYSPQLMIDQSSLLTQDSRNRIFQSEIRNGISLLNQETEKKTEKMVNSLFELNEKKRSAWMKQQKNMDEENRKMAGEDNMEEEKRLEELKKKQEKKEREREKRLVRDRNRRAKVNIETDTEAEVMGRTFASQNPNQAELSREIRANNPLPAARDDSITAITQRTNTEDEAKITDTNTPTTIRIKRKPKPTPTMPSPVDNSINMNNPTTPVQPDNVEEAVVAETPQRRTRARTRLDEEFTEQSNGRWRCNTCNPVVIILKDSRSGHITRPLHKNGGRQPHFRSPSTYGR